MHTLGVEQRSPDTISPTPTFSPTPPLRHYRIAESSKSDVRIYRNFPPFRHGMHHIIPRSPSASLQEHRNRTTLKHHHPSPPKFQQPAPAPSHPSTHTHHQPSSIPNPTPEIPNTLSPISIPNDPKEFLLPSSILLGFPLSPLPAATHAAPTILPNQPTNQTPLALPQNGRS